MLGPAIVIVGLIALASGYRSGWKPGWYNPFK
jgi:hypothetical protein